MKFQTFTTLIQLENRSILHIFYLKLLSCSIMETISLCKPYHLARLKRISPQNREFSPKKVIITEYFWVPLPAWRFSRQNNYQTVEEAWCCYATVNFNPLIIQLLILEDISSTWIHNLRCLSWKNRIYWDVTIKKLLYFHVFLHRSCHNFFWRFGCTKGFR